VFVLINRVSSKNGYPVQLSTKKVEMV